MNTPYSVVSQTNEKPKTTAQIRKSHIDWGNQLIAFLFLIPAILVFATFAWYPISQSTPEIAAYFSTQFQTPGL